MFEKENYSHIPTEYEIKEYINNDLWVDFCKYMKDAYNVAPKFEFSKCSWEYGWNIKFKKGSKSLCTVYPRENYFTILIVIEKNEKKVFENMFSSFSSDIQKIYKETPEGNGQRWLMIDLEDNDKRYKDMKKIIEFRANKW
jgi:hypothetical protein